MPKSRILEKQEITEQNTIFTHKNNSLNLLYYIFS
jgi:hypothetical protein